MKEIKEIISTAGGPVRVAKAIGRTKGAVSQWSVVPSEHVIAVCELSGWKLTPNSVRPDLYPNKHDAMPCSPCGCEAA